MEQQPDATICGLAPVLESRVFCIRNNDPNMNHLFIGSGLDPRAWKQLGRWLHKSSHVSYVCLQSCHLKGKSMEDLCQGLQHNESIREFEIGDNVLRNSDIESLAPFISKNPCLHTLNIDGCLGSGGLALLSAALMRRTRSVENISLDGNCMGSRETRENFDTFVTALSKNTDLRRLSLMGNRLGHESCTSLARLLKNPDSKLKSLILRHNLIDDKCCAILATSLSNNTMLNNIDLDRNENVGAQGLFEFLQLVCRTSGAAINLTLRWECPESTDKMSVGQTIKLNEPLQKLADQLCSNPKFVWASDTSHIKFSIGWKRLDLSKSPFFYGIREGDLVDVTVESEGGGGALQVVLDGGISSNGICDTAQSNHTLSSLGYETALRRGFIHGHLLREFLYANKQENKLSAARVKIFRLHVEYVLNLEDFCEMDIVMPRVLAWIGRALSEADDDRTYCLSNTPMRHQERLESIYHILRAMPMLCGY